MQELVWLIEPIQVWLRGGSLDEITHTNGFIALLVIAAALVPSTIIMLGIGLDEWADTPLGRYFGAAPSDDGAWTDSARDIDKDGMPDF
ncbi:MAG: hypothetical protein NW203_14675 [Hyphomonadaceae bacterium]|nr:hypothetical protein [Hyphomonadaceae bacterium]